MAPLRPIGSTISTTTITSGGTAPFGQAGMAARMQMDLDPDNPAQVRAHAERVAEVLLAGISTGA